MSSGSAGSRPWLTAAALLLLALPPSRRLLETGMLLHMLVQLPLLAAGGWLLGNDLLRRVDWLTSSSWNHRGISGLLLASLVGLAWMLPIALDAAVEQAWIEFLKFLSVPVLIGAAVALGWPRAGFVVRGLVLMEVIAMCFRIGWLYLVAPQRLCANYRVDEQQMLGRVLIAIGVVILAVLAWRLLWGQLRIGDDES